MSDSKQNPFSGLMPQANGSNVTMAEEPTTSGIDSLPKTDQETHKQLSVEEINTMIENVFFITLNKRAKVQLVYMEELAESLKPQSHIDMDTLEQALFERLLLPNPVQYVTIRRDRIMECVVETDVFTYLCEANRNIKLLLYSCKEADKVYLEKMRELIFRNAVTAMKQPALFEDQNFAIQLHDLLKDIDASKKMFVLNIVKHFMADGRPEAVKELRGIMMPVLILLQKDISRCNLINLDYYIMPLMATLAGDQYFAPLILDASVPSRPNSGRSYQDTLLGSLFSLSVLPRVPGAAFEYFDNPMDHLSVNMTESSIWNGLTHVEDGLHKTILCLLRAGGDVRERMLSWLGRCLNQNVARGKLWNMQADLNPATLTCASDGFMLNVGAVLLRLCLPFCSAADDPKSMKIDPTYCAVPPSECGRKSVHLTCLSEETCLLPQREDAEGRLVPRPTAESYNFVTECFFMAHKAIDLGYRVVADKLWRVGQELGRAQRALSAAAAHQSGPGLQPMQQRMQMHMTRFVSLRCSLLEPATLALLSRLHATTSSWLVQVALGPTPPLAPQSYAPMVSRPVYMPLEDEAPETLRCVPELVVENVVNFVTLVRRAAAAAGGAASVPDEAAVATALTPALSLVLAFMGSSDRVKNPHLRARLAECLEAMLPRSTEESGTLSSLGSFYREQLFKDHPHRLQLVPCILDVFVGIEMTGQSVQFEQKFNYRRPMYVVMDFLWEIEDHRECFSNLAREAEENMEAVHPPLFLRFVNLLMNDAIFLLDEALSNMAQIRTMQTAHESGEWNALSASEREQNLRHLAHIGMLARFDNILGRDTVKTLVRLTTHAAYLFCHPTMVERVASMLNYFLMNLVGPNKKNFKVKDMKEFEFEPAAMVLDISSMYVQLGDNERFCDAVCNDGRSYSPQLFELAEAVLVRIGGGGLVGSLRAVAARVHAGAERRARDEEALGDVPDEFLDPIMSTIMLDPVTLPSSRTTLDRTTIARHLLSDQTDPFNRSPLTMDQVKSHVELKAKIQEWIKQRRENASQQASTSKECDSQPLEG